VSQLIPFVLQCELGDSFSFCFDNYNIGYVDKASVGNSADFHYRSLLGLNRSMRVCFPSPGDWDEAGLDGGPQYQFSVTSLPLLIQVIVSTPLFHSNSPLLSQSLQIPEAIIKFSIVNVYRNCSVIVEIPKC